MTTMKSGYSYTEYGNPSGPMHFMPCGCNCGGHVEITNMMMLATDTGEPRKWYLPHHNSSLNSEHVTYSTASGGIYTCE